LKRVCLTLVMSACVLFPILTTLAMLFYPGGTRSNPAAEGYRFFENFFSELGLSRSYSGAPQTASFLLFTTALTLAGAALVLYFCLAPSFFSQTTRLKILSLTGSVFGVVSGLAFIGVAFTPADLYLGPHALFVQLAFLTILIAQIFYAPAIFFHPGFPNLYAWVNALFALLLGVYVWLLFNGPDPGSESGLVIQVTGQKIIAYAAVASVFTTAYGARRLLDDPVQVSHPGERHENQPSRG
jgi:hypothetical protein